MSKRTNKPNTPQEPKQMDLSQIISSAQQIAQSISSEDKDKINKMDMNEMLEHVTNKVFTSMGNGGMNMQLDPNTMQQMKMASKFMLNQFTEELGTDTSNIKSKIDLEDKESSKETKEETNQETNQEILEDKIPKKENIFSELDSDEEVDELRPIVDDLNYNLPVTLEELYTGKVKKLAVTRNRITGKKIVTEKRKIEVSVLPGMKNGQEIRFNKEGNEKLGYESGDIVITLAANAHSEYERIGNILCYVKNISLYESYAAGRGDIKVVIKHLDGSFMILKTDGNPLHTKDGARKIRNGGMPTFNKKINKIEYGDLYLRFNVILPETFEGDDNLAMVEKLFPVLPTNKETLITKKYNPLSTGNFKLREVLLEEVTPEDMEQLDYEEEEEESESHDSDSHSESGSE